MGSVGAQAVHPGGVGDDIHGLVTVGRHRGVGGVGARHLVHHPGDAQVVGDLETLGQAAVRIPGHGGGRRHPGHMVVARVMARVVPRVVT